MQRYLNVDKFSNNELLVKLAQFKADVESLVKEWDGISKVGPSVQMRVSGGLENANTQISVIERELKRRGIDLKAEEKQHERVSTPAPTSKDVLKATELVGDKKI